MEKPKSEAATKKNILAGKEPWRGTTGLSELRRRSDGPDSGRRQGKPEMNERQEKIRQGERTNRSPI